MNCLITQQKPKKGYGFIYRYVSPSGKSYVGQTIHSLKERSKTEGRDYKNCSVFYKAIQKYGWDNFLVEILEECPFCELEGKEKYYIKKYNSLIPNGYNIKSGGSGKSSGKLTKKEIDVYDLKCNYIKTFSSLREAAEEYEIPWQVISQCIRKEIQYYKNWIFTYKNEKPGIPDIKKTHGRITAQYDLQDNLIQIYQSANAAARAIGKNSNAGRNIRSVCEGKRNKAFGYSWRYLD